MYRFRSMIVVSLLLPLCFLLFANSASAKARPESAAAETKRLQAVVSELKTLLQMPQRVDVSIVPSEARMVSVQRSRDASDGTDFFEIHLDQEFFDSLNREELRAALAHEL